MNELKALYKIKESNLPFAFFSDFGTSVVNIIIQNNNNLNFLEDFNKDKGFVFAPFEEGLRKVLIKEDISLKINVNKSFKRKVISINSFFENATKANKNTYTDKEKKLYEEKFNLVKQNISKQIFQKVVISKKEPVLLKDTFNLIDVYIDLILKNPNAFNYIFFHPKVGIWMGSSPEIFLSQKDSLIKTNSLAGTKRKHEIWTQKEKDEQDYVSDYILKIFEEENLKADISERETFFYSNIQHLKNTITANINKSTDINRIINKLHPTPAVCGYPKKVAYNFILSKEGHDREFYTGFLGYNSYDKKDLYVNLRCMKFDLEKAYLYVGGGITKDSVFDDEWEEMKIKIEILKSVL